MPRLRAVHPNAGVEAWYRRQLDKQVQEMQASVVYWLSANYRASGAAVAMDASPAVMMRNAMQKLAKRWTRRFDDMAQKLADRFANDAMKNADASLATAFKDAGFTVEFKMASQMNNALQATIAENVGLIRSIPEKYFTEVEGLVMRSVARGRDLSYLTDELQKRYGISTITFADEGTLATGLKLTEATGAVISQGAAPAVVDDIFTAILAKEQDWVTFSTTFAVTKDQANAFALWTNSQNHRFAYVPWDASGTAIVAGSSNALVYDIINTYAYNDTCPVYGYPTGDIRINGGTGSDGQTGSSLLTGNGGASYFGGGGRAGSQAGIAGAAPGSGGGGAYDLGFIGTAFTGGDGATGMAIVEEFA